MKSGKIWGWNNEQYRLPSSHFLNVYNKFKLHKNPNGFSRALGLKACAWDNAAT